MESGSSSVATMKSDELRRFVAEHKEDDYLLVDVRQPAEYQLGHIPGAELIPVGEIEQHEARLREASDRPIIFYCRSGARSSRAARYAAEQLQAGHVYNLEGGFEGYSGHALSDFPRFKAIDVEGCEVADVLERALDLEKGTHRLYEALLENHAGTETGDLLKKLVNAEILHGKVLFETLAQLRGSSAEDFERAFESLPGDIIESGEPLEEVRERARQAAGTGKLALLELALQIELEAYDLYRNLAARVPQGDMRDALLDLARQEKEHAGYVARSLETATSESVIGPHAG